MRENSSRKRLQVTPELNGAVPGLEGECGGPHIPEFSLEKPGRKPVGDATCGQRIFAGMAEFQQFDTVLHGEPHRSHGDLRAAAVDKPGHRIRLVPLIEFHGFVEDRLAFVVQ